jgi:subtilisin-like proprotein convertase family protein
MQSKILVLMVLVGAVAPAQWSFQYSASQLNAPIPSSGTGGAFGMCASAGNTTVATMTGTDPVKVTDVNVSVSLAHTWASDLRITLSHGGVSVVVFNQHPSTSQKQFWGTYTFDDEAASTIAAAVNPNLLVLASGTYQPNAPLTAFDGTSAAGPWVLEICDLVSGDMGTLYGCSVAVTAGTNLEAAFPYPAMYFDDGGPSGCVAPFTHVFTVPTGAGPVSRIGFGIGLIHGRAADLSITVTHGPVTVTIAAPNTPSTGAILGDVFYFEDDAPTTWDSAVTSAGIYAVPSGTYRPDTPFSAFDGLDASGPWFFTICDSVQNGSIGSIYYLSMGYQTFGYRFWLEQPSGSGSITFKNTGGAPGDLYLNAFTLTPGSFPYGWFHGLDISIAELVNQANLGVPFFGVLDPSGDAAVTVPGPIPAGLVVQLTSVELTQGGLPVASIPARSYTTSP